MPIIDIQRRLTQLGVIRLGRKVAGTGHNGQAIERPEKLDRFRITSPDRALVDAVAAKYGGTVGPWQGPNGPEFEVITDARELPVLVPPQRIDPNYEMWGPGFKNRLCDGQTERKRACPCLCLQGKNGHVHDFEEFEGVCGCGATRECKPTTRLSVMLREIPGLGVMKIESHGRNAAAELPMSSDALENAPVPLPAMLVLRKVDKKRLTNAGRPNEKVESRSFYVPRLIFDWVTPEQAYGGQIEAMARTALAGAAERGLAGADRPAIGSAPEQPAVDWAARIAAATTAVELNTLKGEMQAAGVRDEAIVAAWKARGAAIVAAAEPQPAPVEPPAQVLEADVEPDRDEVWTAILREAKKVGWNLPTVEAKYRERMGHDPSDDDVATGWKLDEFLTALRNGQVK